MTTNDLHREAREWRNRALLAESRLTIAESRTKPHSLPLTDAAREIEEPLPTTSAERE